MDIFIHLILPVIYYSFGISFLLYEIHHTRQKRLQEKRLEKALDNLSKLVNTNKHLDK